MSDIDLTKQREWEGAAGEDLAIAAEYVTPLRFEVVVLVERVNMFRCRDWEPVVKEPDNTSAVTWQFEHVIIDTSKRDASGEVVLQRITYHPYVWLVNVPFMVIPAP